MPVTIAKRVEKGCALLDRKRPGWADEIKLKMFQIDSDNFCVLGQLSKGEPKSLLKKYAGDRASSIAYGFEADYIDEEDELNACWKKAIKSRQDISPKKETNGKKETSTKEKAGSKGKARQAGSD